MQKRSSLLCSAALGVLLAAGIGADAQAKPKHSHVASTTQSQVNSLTDAVSTLEQRLNDETAARQAVEARAAAAEAKADAAEADAQAARSQLQDQIQTIPGAVQTAVAAATPKPKPSWADNTHIGGTIFADFSDISQSPSPNKINGVGADIKRAYLSVDHTFSSIYSANLTLDFAPNGIILNGGTYGTGTLMGSEVIKYAYVAGHYNDAFIVQVGASKMPWIPFVEDVYGYRWIDKVMVDQNKFGNSSDWGINVHGDLASGLFDYSASVVDGNSYKNPSRSADVDFEGRANFNYHGFVAAVGGYYGKRAMDIQATPATNIPTQNASRIDTLLGYTSPTIHAGFEYFWAQNWNTIPGTAAVPAVLTAVPATYTLSCTNPSDLSTCSTVLLTKAIPVSPFIPAKPGRTDNSQGFSFFGSYMFIPQWSVFGRWDYLNPSMILAPKEQYNFADIGINYEPVKNLELGLVYKYENVTHAVSKGYTDATTTLAPNSTGKLHTSGDYNEVGLYTQFKF